MDQLRQAEVLTSLRRTRSHIINALDGTNEKSNVIKDIDRFVNFLNETPLDQITEKDVDYNYSIIKAEINCSLNCFTHALNAIK
ncbi:hypothetical protein [Lactobacillus sp. Sy-1]|uniref:hypothetical protein n=1 Tax=Lactobacillus sp. Sy-1 TaxID=2109645 RepID=UPI001C5A36F4|nr:hypothetical protein [Lactobacillus sp. Sy-1]MBW1605076.1 hypothetical protein [Lactobacillus sp. Sy-1]